MESVKTTEGTKLTEIYNIQNEDLMGMASQLVAHSSSKYRTPTRTDGNIRKEKTS